MFFVQLPAWLLQGCILPLCSLKDVVHLDTALLTHDLRRQLHEHMKNAKLCTDSISITADAARWFMRRNTQVSALRIHIKTLAKDLPALAEIALTVSTHISWTVSATFNSEEVAGFVKACHKAKSLSFEKIVNSSVERCVFEAIAQHCTSLQSITLSGIRPAANQAVNLAVNLSVLTQGCKQLLEINLDNCSLWVDDECIRAIATNCPQLQVVLIKYCHKCTDDALTVLAEHCASLRQLEVRGWQLLTDRSMLALSACRELQSIDLVGTRVTSDSIVALAHNCSMLEVVYFSPRGEHIHLAVAALVQHCRALQGLQFGGSFVSDSWLLELRPCSTLRRLDLANCRTISSSVLMTLLAHCDVEDFNASECSLWDIPPFKPPSASLTHRPHRAEQQGHRLRRFHLSECLSLKDTEFAPFISQCPHLTDFCVYGSTALTNVSMLAVAEQCTQLRDVCINNIVVTDATIVTLVRRNPNLQLLSLDSSRLTDVAACAIAHCCPRLNTLHIPNCLGLTDVGAVHIVEGCRQLQVLSLRGCRSLTSAVLCAMLLYGAALRRVDLKGCSNIMKVEVKEFEKSRPYCVEF